MKPWCILKTTTEPVGPFGTMSQEPWHPGKGAKPDHVILLNCSEVHIHASHNQHGRTSETFRQTMKLTLFRTFKIIVIDLMARKDISNKLMILGSDRKKHQNSVVQQNSSVQQTKVIPDLRMLEKGILLETITLLVYFLWLVVFANNRIADHLQISGLFSDFQDGFRSSWSITDLLIELLGLLTGHTWYIQGYWKGLV